MINNISSHIAVAKMWLNTSILILSALISHSAVASEYERITLDDGRLLELSTEALAPDEGYLVLEVTPNSQIERLVVSKFGAFAAKFVLKDISDKSVHIIKLKQGKYYFSEFKVPGQRYVDLDKGFTFNIQEGVINYPGELLINAAFIGYLYRTSFRNRLFRFTELYGSHLREQYPGIQLIYNGPYEDSAALEADLCCD